MRLNREQYMVLLALRDGLTTSQLVEWGVSYVELAEILYQLVGARFVVVETTSVEGKSFDLRLSAAGLQVVGGPLPGRPERRTKLAGEVAPVAADSLFFIPDS